MLGQVVLGKTKETVRRSDHLSGDWVKGGVVIALPSMAKLFCVDKLQVPSAKWEDVILFPLISLTTFIRW